MEVEGWSGGRGNPAPLAGEAGEAPVVVVVWGFLTSPSFYAGLRRRLLVRLGQDHAAGDRGQVDAHMARRGRPARETGREEKLRGVAAGEPRDQARELDVEVGEEPHRAQRREPLEHPYVSSPAMSASRASTRARPGRAWKTPRAGPLAGSRPRRKR